MKKSLKKYNGKKRSNGKKKKSQDGTKVLQMNGDIENIEDGKMIFRKYSKSLVELSIAKILKDNPHNNIANILHVHEGEDSYFEMDLVDIDYICWVNNEKKMKYIYKKLLSVKKHLQNLGIFYIDWKIDNFGFSYDHKEPKLFDFDVSSLYDKETKEISFFEGYLLKDAVKKLFSVFAVQESGINLEKIKQIDDYIFEQMFIELCEEYL